MGTSNWQQIPFCIDALMKMEPHRVLDVGVGFGRWGMIVREFCDVWFSRVFRDDWKVELEGIEAFPRSITDYHRAFYNRIHLGDAAEVIPTLPGPWSVTIYGDVLEHFTPEKARELLNFSLDHSEYVIVNIPIGEEHPQGEAYGNVYERHLSSWHAHDFVPFGLVRQLLLKDYIGRDYGSFILSRSDPRNLRESLFSRNATYSNEPAPTLDGSLAHLASRVEERLREQSFALAFTRRSASYRLASRLRANPLMRFIRSLTAGSGDTLRVRPFPPPGGKVAILGVHSSHTEPGIPWDFIRSTGDFSAQPSEHGAHSQSLTGAQGFVEVRTSADPKVLVSSSAPGTRLEVSFNGRTETLTLPEGAGEVTIFPARTPMLPRPAQRPAAQIEATNPPGTVRIIGETARAAASEPVGAH